MCRRLSIWNIPEPMKPIPKTSLLELRNHHINIIIRAGYLDATPNWRSTYPSLCLCWHMGLVIMDFFRTVHTNSRIIREKSIANDCIQSLRGFHNSRENRQTTTEMAWPCTPYEWARASMEEISPRDRQRHKQKRTRGKPLVSLLMCSFLSL